MRTLKELPRFDLDHAGADRIRRRCHRALTRRSRPAILAERTRDRSARPFLEPALVAGISAAYLFEVFHRALLLYGL
jgi:hypothetical protein